MSAYRTNARHIELPLKPHLRPRVTRMSKWRSDDHCLGLEWDAGTPFLSLTAWDKTGSPEQHIRLSLDAARTLRAALDIAIDEALPGVSETKEGT